MGNWKGWLIGILLVSTAYVQSVGKNIEMITGAIRQENLPMYRVLLGGPPWIAWMFFRWGGFIQIVCFIALAWIFGFKALLVGIVGLLVFIFISPTVARRHAAEMLRQLDQRIKAEGRGQ